MDNEFKPVLKQSISNLLDYCCRNNWSGYDPYDGLNSQIFSSIPFVQNRIGRLFFIQAMKRSALNFRPIFFVKKEHNPKGLAVSCKALLILSKIGFFRNDEILLQLIKRLIDLKSPDSPYSCWGYNFDWQSRTFFLPKFNPNIICTTFAGNALIDAYERFNNTKFLEMALSAGKFLMEGFHLVQY